MKLELYKDRKRETRWRLKAANGKKVASSGEGYKNKADCLHGLRLVIEGGAKALEDFEKREGTS